MNKLFYVEISDIANADEFNQLLTFVPKEKQEQVKRFHFDIDKKLSLYSEVLVRAIIGQALNINNNDIIFERNKYGKPHLKERPDINFNLSHTRNAIAIAVSNNQVGVDIEKIISADIKIAKRFFTESEVAYITKTELEKDKRCYEVWTKKEAYIKYIGEGLSIPLNSFDVLNSDISKQKQTIGKGDYIISICSEYSNQIFDIIELSENDIENMATDFL